MKNYLFILLILSLAAGCQANAPVPSEDDGPGGQGSGQIPISGETEVAATIAALTPSATHTPQPTSTAEMHPMSIDAMRGREYPGSEIVIERELTAAANYKRYYAYYLSDGLKIYALLTVPTGEKPEGGWPAIVFNHGYIAPQAYRTTERYVAYVDRLAKAGFIVFRIDYRGHDMSEGQARGAYGHPGYTIDVLNAIGALKQFPDANPEKIGMWGHSMGGYLTLRSMVISKDIKAGVIWGGVVGSYDEMLTRWRPHTMPSTSDPDSQVSWRQYWLSRYGTPEENPEFWESVSATSYLQDLSGPLLLQHAGQDKDVPVEFSRSLTRRIEDIDGEVELIVYEDDDHDITKYFTVAMNRAVEFFDENLK